MEVLILRRRPGKFFARNMLRTETTAQRMKEQRGSTLIEATLIAPWFLFLFMGVIDLGFYTNSLISVENAVRVAAEYTSSSDATKADQSGACTLVKKELASLPNTANLAGNCNSSPLIVTVDDATPGPDGKPASTVSVTYQGISLFPIPGLMMGRLSFTRTACMRVRP
jgi:Flp pilus assembly protein TadG